MGRREGSNTGPRKEPNKVPSEGPSKAPGKCLNKGRRDGPNKGPREGPHKGPREASKGRGTTVAQGQGPKRAQRCGPTRAQGKDPTRTQGQNLRHSTAPPSTANQIFSDRSFFCKAKDLCCTLTYVFLLLSCLFVNITMVMAPCIKALSMIDGATAFMATAFFDITSFAFLQMLPL